MPSLILITLICRDGFPQQGNLYDLLGLGDLQLQEVVTDHPKMKFSLTMSLMSIV